MPGKRPPGDGSYDYVVVGAGTAGCIVAARLAALTQKTVALVEEGGSARNPFLRVPKSFYYTMNWKAYSRTYLPTNSTSPTDAWTRGKGVGGTSLINGMTYNRGSQADYDRVQQDHGFPWGWNDFLGAYLEIENHELGAGPTRGVNGPVSITIDRHPDPMLDVIVDALGAMGVPFVHDVNAADGDRVGPTPAMIRRGRRVTPLSALASTTRGGRLAVLTGLRAARIHFTGSTARGVELIGRRGPVTLVARRQVVVCLGALETPLLLERSGIGDPAVLHGLGIDVRADVPAVGNGLVEQRAVKIQFELRPGLGLNHQLRSWSGRSRAAARYALTRQGPLSTGAYGLLSYHTSTRARNPDIQGIWGPVSFSYKNGRPRLDERPGMVFLGYPAFPRTESSIHSDSSGRLPYKLETNFLKDSVDRRVCGEIAEVARTAAATGPLAELVVGEHEASRHAISPSDIVDYSARTGGGIYHAVGSCALRRGDKGVVDRRLAVRGVRGLRIVDASVFPSMVAGHPVASVMALAWLAASEIASSA